MMSNTLVAPLGGTTRGAHHGVDSEAFCFMTPPNFGLGPGTCFGSRVVVPPGEPEPPFDCWPNAEKVLTTKIVINIDQAIEVLIECMTPSPFNAPDSPRGAGRRR